MAEGLVLRDATMEDREAIFAINDNIYEGRDFLDAYFDHFIESPDTFPTVCELDGKVVGFCAFSLVDGGKTIVMRTARSSPNTKSLGIIRRSYALIAHSFRRSADITNLAYSSSWQSDFHKITNSATVLRRDDHGYLVDPTREAVKNGIASLLCSPYSKRELKELGEQDILKLLENEQQSSYLFPFKRMVVDRVPLRLQPENVAKIFGRNTVFLSDVHSDSEGTYGMMSSSSLFKSKDPEYSAMIDVYGHRMDSLTEHLASHFHRISTITNKPFHTCIRSDPMITYDLLDNELSVFGLTIYGMSPVQKCTCTSTSYDTPNALIVAFLLDFVSDLSKEISLSLYSSRCT